jgi:DNA-binding NarL/FixJ family response regulator
LKKILLIMDRKILAQALLAEMRDNSDFVFFTEYNYPKATVSADVFRPDAILMEVPESTEATFAECLDVCDEIRQILPTCKIILLSPEGDPKIRELTIEAVRYGRVDDFLYYDTSLQYLISKLEAL